MAPLLWPVPPPKLTATPSDPCETKDEVILAETTSASPCTALSTVTAAPVREKRLWATPDHRSSV